MSDGMNNTGAFLSFGNGRRRRTLTALGVLLCGAVLAALSFRAIRSGDREHALWEFERISRDHVSSLWKTLEVDFLVLHSVQSLYSSSNAVSNKEFIDFAAPLIEDHPSIRALQWLPRVPGPDGEDTFPIEWAVPRGANAESLGFNLASNPSCLDAMQRARKRGRIVMTDKTVLPYELGEQAGIRVFAPVFRRQAGENSAHTSADDLHGFVVAVLRLKGIAEESLASLTPVGIDISLLDGTPDARQQLLYTYNSRTRILDTAAQAGAVAPAENADFIVTVKKKVAGRNWTVVCAATPQFFAGRTTVYPWIGAAAVLLLTGLLMGYLLRSGRMAAMLADNERKLRGILDQIFQFVGLLTPDGRLVDVNKAALDFAGVPKSRVLNKLFWETIWWKHSPKLQEEVRRAVQKAADGFSIRIEATHLRPDGSTRWIDVSLKPLHDDNGKVEYIIPEGYDVTDHKLAVQQQGRSIDRLEQLNRLQEELLSPGTMEEKFKKITDAAVRILDLDFARVWIIGRGDLCKFGCKHFLSAEGAHVCLNREKCLQLVASSGRYTQTDGEHRRVPLGCFKIGHIAVGSEKKFVTNNVTGDPRIHDHEWAKDLGLVSFAGYKLHDDEGNPIGVMAMFAKHPITEEDDAFLSNLAEIASKTVLDCKAADALRTSERRHRLFAENVTDVIWTADFSGLFTYISPSLERLLGFKWDEEMRLTLPDIMTPASFALSQKTLEHLYTDGREGRRVEARIELEMLRKDGSTLWAEVTVGGMFNEFNQLVGVLGTARDITARRNMELELRRAKEDAETATRAKSRFLARISHEIRNPMTSILGYTDLMMDPAVTESSRNNYLAVIRRNGEHLLALVNDILDLSKIEAGKLALDLRRCNLASLLADVASAVRPRAKQRGLALSVEYGTEIPETILTDAARLRQALINLAGNAVKFTQRGSVRIAASFLPAWQGQPAVRIQVIDTGIGISESVLPKLFEPFFQGDDTIFRQYGGSGLGLAISRHIVAMLGGELAAASTLGKGSNFNITVPTGDLEGIAMLKNPTEAELGSAELPSDQPEKELEGLRLLLAEDGYDNRQLIQTILVGAGAVVDTAENGREAVEMAEAEPFDAILMDMNMPVMDGYEATRLLRQHGYDRPILALTANAMSNDGALSLAAGCNRHLTKPIDRTWLIHAIAVCTGRKPSDAAEPAAPAATHAARTYEPIVSLYADDPDVSGILEDFVEGLDGQLNDMGLALAEERYEDLKRLAHRLKGAGGSYGYSALTDAGKKLEDAAAGREREAADLALEDVACLCRAVKEGLHLAPAGNAGKQETIAGG